MDEFEKNITQDLWPHQQECIRTVNQHLNNGTKCGYINMATGTGKTRVFSTLVHILSVKTLIVVPTTLLIEQAQDALALIAPNLDVGIFDGTQKRKGANVTLTTYASFEKHYELFADAKLIILDEVHSSLSEKRIEAVKTFQDQLQMEGSSSPHTTIIEKPIILGFTATEQFNGRRKKGDYAEVEKLLTTRFFEYGIKQGIDQGILHPINIINLEIDDVDLKKILTRRKHTNTEDAEITAKELEVLKKIEINRVIADFIFNVTNPETKKTFRNESGLIFAIDIHHAVHIAETINLACPNYAAFIHSQMSKHDQKNILDQHKSGEIKVLVNVDMLTVGYDDAKLKFIIDFRPTKSSVRLIQTFGRLTRKDDETSCAKSYIQLVIPNLNLTAGELFDGEMTLGISTKVKISPTTIRPMMMNVGSHSNYQATFSHSGTIRRGTPMYISGGALAAQPGLAYSSSFGFFNQNQTNEWAFSACAPSQKIDEPFHTSGELSDFIPVEQAISSSSSNNNTTVTIGQKRAYDESFGNK